jgi:AcrR family transcriptional regulator
VLETVRNLLISDGFDSVTHLQVSERSGVGRATIYRHWPDRTSLIYDALADTARAVHVPRTGYFVPDLLKALTQIRLELVDHDLGKVLAGMIDRAEWEPTLATLKCALVEAGTSGVSALLLDAVRTGDLREDLDVKQAVSQLVGPIVYRRLISGETVSRAFLRSIVEDFVAVWSAAVT